MSPQDILSPEQAIEAASFAYDANLEPLQEILAAAFGRLDPQNPPHPFLLACGISEQLCLAQGNKLLRLNPFTGEPAMLPIQASTLMWAMHSALAPFPKSRNFPMLHHPMRHPPIAFELLIEMPGLEPQLNEMPGLRTQTFLPRMKHLCDARARLKSLFGCPLEPGQESAILAFLTEGTGLDPSLAYLEAAKDLEKLLRDDSEAGRFCAAWLSELAQGGWGGDFNAPLFGAAQARLESLSILDTTPNASSETRRSGL